MRYRGMTELNIIYSVLFFFMAVYGGIVTFTRWQDLDNGVRVFMAIMFCIPIAGLFYSISRILHPSCYAEIRDEGICIFSKEAGELTFIDWKDVRDYRYVDFDVDAPHIPYDLLIFQRTAPFGDNKSISMLKRYRAAETSTITKYRLDELMQKLHEGTMTVEEFKNLPYLFLVSIRKDYRKREEPTEIEQLWRARRFDKNSKS